MAHDHAKLKSEEKIQIVELFIHKKTYEDGCEMANLIAQDIKGNQYRFVYEKLDENGIDHYHVSLSIEQLSV